MTDDETTIRISEDGVELPVIEILTGRGFITGKSGSGKSNTANVVAEELLKQNYPVLIVDTDGEYFTLKEKFELLHVGADENCDIQIGPGHAEKIAELALEQNVPVILDVSGFLEEDPARTLIASVVRALFAKEKSLKKPFMLVVEEIHEYIPETGGLDDCGRTLIRVGKRGRKHGLGICGISQRPANVKKDFITQCDWLVWHRLTWDTDTKVVERMIDADAAETVQELDDGEALLMTDWDESLQRIQFKRKETFDAGATPSLEDYEPPEFMDVNEALVDELESFAPGTDADAETDAELRELRERLEHKDQRIEELEAEVERLESEPPAAPEVLEAEEVAAEADGGDVAGPPPGPVTPAPEEGSNLLVEFGALVVHLTAVAAAKARRLWWALLDAVLEPRGTYRTSHRTRRRSRVDPVKAGLGVLAALALLVLLAYVALA